MTIQKENKSCHVTISTTPFYYQGAKKYPLPGETAISTGSTIYTLSYISTKCKPSRV